MKRLPAVIGPSAYREHDQVLLPLPPLVLTELVKALGAALRDDDEVAGLMLKAAEPPTWRADQTVAAVHVLARADLLNTAITYPAAVFAADVRQLVADLAPPATAAPIDDDGPVFRLCSTCHTLTQDCRPGTPTTCAKCAERTTR